MLVELIGTSIVALILIYIYFKFVIFNFWRKRGVFYVEPVFPTGNITNLITGKVQIGVLFQHAYMKYKDHRAFGMYSLYRPNLVIADLDLIRTVLIKEFENFHDRGMYCNEKIDPLSGHLFALSGKKWKNLRIKMTPTFTSGKIKNMFSILKECSEDLIKNLEGNARTSDSIEIKDILARYTTDVIMSIAFGIKSNCIEEPDNEYRKQAKKIFELNPVLVALFIYVPKILDLLSISITNRSVISFYMKMFQENVRYRQTHNIVRHDFMNLLIQLMERGYVEPDDGKKATNESPNVSKLTMTEAIAQSYIFFIAGFETSSTTAAFVLYELAQHQDIQDKVREEIDEMLAKHDDLTYDVLNEMTYLQKVLKETMRKYPPLPILNRICTKEIVLPTTDILVPKGTLITIPLLGVHRDPSIYPDPDKFDPERFNADNVKKRHPYAYLPFGEGPRNCIGARFANLQMKIVLVYLLSKFKFKLHSRTQVPIVFNEKFLVLSSKGDVYLNIEPR